ncbi:hypothetical protein Avbf_10160, partial [Armadillidium vulgare]
LWFVFVGLYSFFFGSTVLLFPNLFGGDDGGGSQGGGPPTGGLVGPPSRPSPPRPPKPPIRPQQIYQITTAVETSPYPDKTTASTTSSTTSMRPQLDQKPPSTIPSFIFSDSIPIYSILHACLSLGGKKPDCKLQAIN